MSKKKSNSLGNKIQNINEEFEKVSDDLDKELSKFEKVGDIFNDSLDRVAGSVSDQEVDKLIEQMQSEVNLDKKSAALGKQKDQEIADRLKAIRDPRPTEEALKNPAPTPTVEELEARLKKLKDSTPTVEKPPKKVEKSKAPDVKQSQSVKSTKKVVNKVATRPKDNKLEASSPATPSEPVVRKLPESDKSDRGDLPPSVTKPEQTSPEKTTNWFAKIVNAIIDVIVDNIKGLLGNSQIQDAPKQQGQQISLEKIQADVKKLNEPLVALKKRQEVRDKELMVKKIRNSLQKVRTGKTLSSTPAAKLPTRSPTKSPITRQKSNTNSR
ncbi:hypothetical protein [Candidatus Tisiphia endosymbiont of Hybos culiciformis]|uniref:hypothetical protein n=1 Tax=Candidatus Tisiphia endosymbiont of Hybos culiciformis TaxID=3139331 RepID=UPI003CCA92BD